MGFFDTEEGVDEYLKLAEGFDVAELIKILQAFVPKKPLYWSSEWNICELVLLRIQA
jgi:hypothetical protein